ncbi:acetate--CoA ligase family protein [Solibacillus sp. FSL K6-4121]|uniref:acetate--CoA ligase family protein n=1 Tax=Solibacillus sp. FSL K6-4121 TaxID=2921505 RepID=UPI0030F90AD1
MKITKELGVHRFLMEYEGAEILQKFKLPVIESFLAETEEQAVLMAEKIGYPVVLKGMSREITHKTEAGIVKVSISNEVQLREAYRQIIHNTKAYDIQALLVGVLVQKMAPKGIELILGVKRDDVFGHQLILGYGGTLVEIMKDFSMRMLPVSEQEVDEMIKELKTAPILLGYRGQSGIDIDKLKDICRNINRLVELQPDIEELDLNPIIFANSEAYICDVRMLKSSLIRDQKEINLLDGLDKMLNPTSVAIVGASEDAKKTGGRLLKYLVENNFEGSVYPVNPKASEIRGYKAYPSIKEIPDTIDVACIVVAAKFVPNVMRDCVERGVKNVMIYSSGFVEVGEHGKALQKEVLTIAKQGNIRILGPNTIGLASPSKNIYTAFGSALETKNKIAGSIGFISQSGAMGSALLSRAWEDNIGFSRWISVANEADLTTSDFIQVLAQDEMTKVISVFMEGLKDVEAFERATTAAFKQQKPVLVYKTGRTDAGKKAVQSHTGSMAGDDAVYEAVFRKYNVLRVNQVEELVDIAAAFEIQPLPKGKRIGIITASGGACSILADLCSNAGLEVAEFTNNAELLHKLVPEFGSPKNPIDVTAEIIGKPEMFKKILEAVVADEGIDGVLVMMTSNADPGAEVIAEAITDVFKQSTKPIVLGRLGATAIAPKGMEYYRKQNFVVYPNPEKIVRVMKYLVDYSTMLRKS